MKIEKSVLVGLLVGLGFAKAKGWDDEKLADRAGQIPVKVDSDEVPDAHKATYAALKEAVASEDTIEVVADGEAGKPKKGPSKEAKELTAPPAKKAAKAVPQEDPAPAKSEKKSKRAKEKDTLDEDAADSKPTPPKPKVKQKTAIYHKEPVVRDSFGCAVGSISAAVNKVMTDEWQDEQEIAKKCGIDLEHTRGRLYYAAEKEVFEHRRLIQYRVNPNFTKAAPATPAKASAKVPAQPELPLAKAAAKKRKR